MRKFFCKTDAHLYYDSIDHYTLLMNLHDYIDGKRSITQHQGNNAIRFAGDPKNNNLNVNFNKKNNEINDSINSGQNFQQKDKYYEIGSLVEEFERDIAEAALQ